MTLLYDRVCIAQIGDVRIAGLRMAFRCELTESSKPNAVELDIFNLSDQLFSRISRKRPVQIEGKVVLKSETLSLEAGYKDEFGLIFLGDELTVRKTSAGTNTVTKITAGDGQQAIRSARAAVSLGPNTKKADIAGALLDSLKAKGLNVDKAKERLKRGDFRGGIQEIVNGFTFSGPSWHELERQVRDMGLGVSVQRGEVQILARDETTQEQQYVLGAASGLVEEPAEDEKGNIKFKTLMLSPLVPGLRVMLEGRRKQGVVKLTSVIRRGDTRGGEWVCECVGRAV